MSQNKPQDDSNIFQVSGSMAFFSWLICEHPGIWQKLGQLETSMVADSLDDIQINNPVYVSGLARSGSTILLEILAGIPGVASQQYKDFPPVFTPYAWNTLLRHMKTGPATPAERAHKDGIMVTEESPEAMEEPIWMSFFPSAHDPEHSNVIDAATADHGFGEFYRSHIQKLLAVREGTRYLAKANYQVTRLEYLLHIFPDARFVIPVREPAAHIASLIKQHDLFSRGQRANPRAREHLRRVGHYEFGLDRVPINTGDDAATRNVLDLWNQGEELAGWIAYWSQVYGYLADRVDANPALRDATRFVVFEELCADPDQQLRQIFDHCKFELDNSFLLAAANRISAPTYYKSGFSDAELFEIAQGAGSTMDRIKSLR